MSVSDPLRAAIYTRISEKDSKVDKVEVQEKRLRALANTEGLAVVDVYTDDGISGWSGTRRSDWNRIRSDIGLGKIDVVLTDRQDRFARSSLETEAFKLLCKQNAVTWMFANGSTMDPADYMDAAMASFQGVMAQMESDIKKERLRARYADEISQGNALWGTRPFGYTSARDGVVIPEEKALIEGAYDTIMRKDDPDEVPKRDTTLYSIAKRWNVAGIKTTRGNEWTYQTVRQLLLRPRNAGLVVRDGVVQEGITGTWEPLVTRETLADTTALLSQSGRLTAPGRKQKYLCSGLITCGVCGGPMRSHTVKVRGVVTPHYRCAAKLRVSTDERRHTAIAVGQLDPMVRHEVISAFLFSTGEISSAGKGTDTAPLHKAQAAVRASRQEFMTLIRLGALTAAQAAKDLKELSKQDEVLTAQLRVAAEESAHAAMTVDLREGLFKNGRVSIKDAVAARTQLSEKFDSLGLDQRRELVKSLLEIKINPGRKVQRIMIKHKVVLSLNDPEGALPEHEENSSR
ncbi:recombinase family protein [Cryobacterium sp. PAMC25264]|uniref:recombinase family protein n=1 Tax=Cryobacterium sp. PAMC25264 TaxID=2861288 RepID=UPI001C63B04F|nr:recombinase family protein [Cryobacterium sp. PAMC25264]QYF74143.1 recombinase family protein [Cryobacterium sp. PAMC25264]